MDERRRALVEAALRGDAAAVLEVADALREGGSVDATLIRRLATSSNAALRVAVVRAGPRLVPPLPRELLSALAGDVDVAVRRAFAQTAEANRDWEVDEALRLLLDDVDATS